VQGIYSYIPETNYVSGVYNVAAILWLQFMVHVMLLLMLNVLLLWYFPKYMRKARYCICLWFLYVVLSHCVARAFSGLFGSGSSFSGVYWFYCYFYIPHAL